MVITCSRLHPQKQILRRKEQRAALGLSLSVPTPTPIQMPTVLPAPVGISPEHRDADLQRESLLYLEFPLQGRNCKSASTSTNAKQKTQASQMRRGAREGPSGCASHGVASSRSFGFLNPRLLFAPCLLPPAPCPSFIHSFTFMGIHSGETAMVTVRCGGGGMDMNQIMMAQRELWSRVSPRQRDIDWG